LITLVAILAVTVGGVILQAWRMHEAHNDGRSLETPVDIAIVFGASLDPDGLPSYASRRRVAAAVRLLESGRAERLLFTGAFGKNWQWSAAAVMKDYAVELGANPERLIVESKARSTLDNIRFSGDIIAADGATRSALVTDNYHMTGTRLLARDLGLGRGQPVTVQGVRFESRVQRSWSILREALAWWLNVGKIGALEALRIAGVPEERRRAMIR